jgi:predicted alpha/beta-hydrolase family hydrolase
LKSPNRLTVPLEAGATTALVYPAQGQAIDRTLILAHGAGAGQQSGFMVSFANALAALGANVVTFNFLYTEQRRRIPDRAPALEACYAAVIAVVRDRVAGASGSLFIGGKSMGGRIATQVVAADESLAVEGLVLLGYPLHPPGKPEQLRDKHLPFVRRPMLFVQGSRDAFGTPVELEPILCTLTPRPLLHVIAGGDHSFKVPGRNADTQNEVYAGIQRQIVAWMRATGAKARVP